MNERPKELYHFTTQTKFFQILKAGHLKLTPSNILRPKNPHFVELPGGGKAFVDETDSYKPVVWLTDSRKPDNLGLEGKGEKCIVRITVRMKPEYIRWVEWDAVDEMDEEWKSALTKHCNYESWWISEQEIPLAGETIKILNLDDHQLLYDNKRDSIDEFLDTMEDIRKNF